MFGEVRKFITGKEDVLLRVDKFLSNTNLCSRSYFHKMFDDGRVTVNGKVSRANRVLSLGDVVEVNFPKVSGTVIAPFEFELNILFEDENLIIIDKPAGLVVHPGEGNSHRDDTLVNALQFKYGSEYFAISGERRPGIVHRLDKDTSGLIVVAKNDDAMKYMLDKFKKRDIVKKYLLLVEGKLSSKNGVIDAPIARSSRDRKKMDIHPGGRKSLTEFTVIKEYQFQKKVYSLIEASLLTGRTHQIRVHFKSIGHCLVGDRLYGSPKTNTLFLEKFGLNRQFLHASYLEFVNLDNKKIQQTSELPAELSVVINGIS